MIAGLPGSEASHDRAGIRERIARYEGLGAEGVRANLIAFLKDIIPTAERLGLRMCIHPDDPPLPLFGLPRVVSGLADYQALHDAVPEMSNGVTFCTGSLGAGPQNDVEAAAKALAPRIHFAHLRNVTVEPDGSFFEDDHLAGRRRHGLGRRHAAGRGGAAARGGAHGRGDPVPARPRPPAARRPGEEDLSRLFGDRPAARGWPSCAGSSRRWSARLEARRVERLRGRAAGRQPGRSTGSCDDGVPELSSHACDSTQVAEAAG